ncbi:hypothetical protein Bca4012_062789 [Brassica carinata]|uniref:Uncharacterized protein n=1 Tax=Brassica carinata TaxID=52824 RepID=A0A8X7SCJ9_BRACI|nr:hypothetical protein Bca52824_032468 [Brassica carinata]
MATLYTLLANLKTGCCSNTAKVDMLFLDELSTLTAYPTNCGCIQSPYVTDTFSLKFVELAVGPPPIPLFRFHSYEQLQALANTNIDFLDAYFSVPALMMKLATAHTSITCGAVPTNQTAPPTETTKTAQATVSDSSATEPHVAAAERALKKPRKA